MDPMLLPGHEDGAVPTDRNRPAHRGNLDERAERIPARAEAADRIVVHGHRAHGLAPLDGREVAAQNLLAVFAPEVELTNVGRARGEVPELLQVVEAVRHRDEHAARAQDPRELGEPAIQISDVVQHPRRERDVELPVRKRQRLHVADARVDPLRPLHADHCRGLVDSHELHSELLDQAFGELAFAAPDLEHALRLRGCNRLERPLAWIVALGVLVRRLPRAEILWCRVLLANERLAVNAQRRAALGSGSSSDAISSRIFSSDRRIRRETCICEMPTCCAICDCVSPSKKRSWRIFRSRSSSALKPGARTARSSETSYWCSSVPSDSSGSRSSSSPPPPPTDSERDVYARPDSSASSTSSSSTPAAFASSGIVGERLSCTVSCSTSRESWTFNSCRPRGTRTDQPLSRKCRLISPMMFGVAYVVSSTPRSRSNRSIALIRPIAPICTRSSSCSPRYE